MKGTKAVTAWAAVVSVICAANLARAGWEYTAATKTEGQGSQGGSAAVAIKAWLDGDKARIEFIGGDNPMMADGTYLITQDAGKTMYLVNPKEKAFSVWNMHEMMGMAGGAMKMMNFKILNPKVETLERGSGGPVAGFATTRHKFRTSYGMEMSIMGMKRSSVVTRDEEIWTTDEVKDIAQSAWSRFSEMKFGNEELDKLIEMERGKIKGFPLKTVSVQMTRDQGGKEEVSRSVTEVTRLAKASLATGLFELPAGFKEQRSFLPLADDEPAGEDENEEQPDGRQQGTPDIEGLLKRLPGFRGK